VITGMFHMPFAVMEHSRDHARMLLN